MRYYKITTITFILFILISCKESIPLISRGKLTEDWVYKNETMNFSLQLPSAWNFIDNESGQSKFIPMNQKFTSQIIPNDKIKITQEFEISQEKSIYPLFTITRNNLDNIRFGKRKADITFSVISSENGNAEDDIKSIQKKIIKSFESNNYLNINKKNLESLDKLQFGRNKEIPYINISIPDINGDISGNRIYALNNYDNYDLLLIITYFNEEELNSAKKIISGIK